MKPWQGTFPLCLQVATRAGTRCTFLAWTTAWIRRQKSAPHAAISACLTVTDRPRAFGPICKSSWNEAQKACPNPRRCHHDRADGGRPNNPTETGMQACDADWRSPMECSKPPSPFRSGWAGCSSTHFRTASRPSSSTTCRTRSSQRKSIGCAALTRSAGQ
ncbi:hypothetical protein D3C71_1727950 [compost metagenome]